MINLPVIIHGITGRMGQVAAKALQRIAAEQIVKIDGELVHPILIGVGRNIDKLKLIAEAINIDHFTTNITQAYEIARKINPAHQLYHCTIATGIRKEIMLSDLVIMDPKTTAVFMEKPIAANYADGLAIVEKLEQEKFKHGVVHHMLEAPGVKKALELIPAIKPFHCHMEFGYEVASGFGERQYCCQRPDFNWTLREAGGGILLDMCHEGYLSEALFGETEYLSAVARLLIERRLAYDRDGIIECDVEDYAAIRREHSNGVVNTSIWTWYRRINSEFGPLEITVDGENGSMVFGLYGLKVQWKETAPLLLWERALDNLKIQWRDYWQYLDLSYQDPFAVELADYIETIFTGKPYWKNAIHALNILGQVESLYQSAADNGRPIHRNQFLRYPNRVASQWQPERLQGKLAKVNS